MNCPGCNREIGEVNQCPICQFDIALYNKIRGISVRLYNEGLEQAKNRDLTGAIESLSKSIQFDKSNIDARNLLGLVYFEIGQIGEAITQWVISSNFKKEDNIAIDYIEQIQNNKRKLEQYNDSIRMYNQALEYAKQKSQDLAIIQLKKAISQNPNFVDAYCLLGLCFITQNEKEKAAAYIEKALEIDMNHPKAIRYYREIRLTASRLKTNERVKSIPKHEQRVTPRSSFSPIGQIMGFILGIICTAAVLLILVVPDKTNKLNRQINDLNVENQRLEQEISRVTSESQETINKLEEENKKMEEANEELLQKQEALEEVQKINQVDILYKSGNIEEAASLLYSIDLDRIPEESKTLYNTLGNKVFKDAGRLLYNNGQKAYSRGDYDEAKLNFEKSMIYVQDEYYSDNVLYYLGRIYEAQEDIDKAKEVYNKAVNQYGGTDGANNAKWRLGRLE